LRKRNVGVRYTQASLIDSYPYQPGSTTVLIIIRNACFIAFRPAMILRDPDLIKQILVRDFNIFYDRKVRSNEKTDPLSQNLFLLKGTPWKYLRTKMTPIFTSFRMKQMFPLINTCAKQLNEYLKNNINLEKSVEMKEIAGKYATDVITSCAFGIESNCLLDANAEFREFGRKIFDFSVYRSFEFMSIFMLPLVSKLMNTKFFSDQATRFLRKAFWDNMTQRERNNIKREDFMQLLIELKNENKLSGEAQKNETCNGSVEENIFGKWIRYDNLLVVNELVQ